MQRFILLIGLPFLMVISCTSTRSFGPFPPSSTPAEVGDVLFVGEDGNIHTVDSRTGDSVQLTTLSERYGGTPHTYDQPHWSPDGQRISYVATHRSGDRERTYYLYVHDLREGRVLTREIDGSNPPAYTQWAPDSRRLSFLRSSDETGLLEIVIWDVETDEQIEVLDDRPLFWDWGPTGGFLVAHGGTSSIRGGQGRVSVVRFEADEPPAVEELDLEAGYFQVPVVAPSGDAFAINVFNEEFGTALGIHDIETGEIQLRGALFSAGAFGWSPDGERIAYITGLRRPTGEITGNLRIAERESGDRLVSSDGILPPEQSLVQAPSLGGVNAFYWSPDGSMIAFYRSERTEDDNGTLELRVRLGFIDTVSGRAFELPSQRPTASLSGTVIPYFDQYKRSGHLFSRDGGSFLMNVRTEDGRPGIYLVDTGDLSSRLIAHGHMPVYRP